MLSQVIKKQYCHSTQLIYREVAFYSVLSPMGITIPFIPFFFFRVCIISRHSLGSTLAAKQKHEGINVKYLTAFMSLPRVRST